MLNTRLILYRNKLQFEPTSKICAKRSAAYVKRLAAYATYTKRLGRKLATYAERLGRKLATCAKR